MRTDLIEVTDAHGKTSVADWLNEEPHPGSVLLTDGEFGTAWQRYFNDGLWHRVGGGGAGKPWMFFLTKRNVVLVYDAHERD